MVEFAGDSDLATMSLHDLIDVVETEAEAGNSAFAVLLMDGRTPELVEDDALILTGDADAVVVHLQKYVLIAVLSRDADLNVFLRVLDGVIDEVGNGFGEILFIGEDVTDEQINDEINIFVRFRLRFLHDIVDDRLEVYGLLVEDELLVFELRDSEQLIDKCQQMFRLTLDDSVVFLFNLRFIVHLSAVEEAGAHND